MREGSEGWGLGIGLGREGEGSLRPVRALYEFPGSSQHHAKHSVQPLPPSSSVIRTPEKPIISLGLGAVTPLTRSASPLPLAFMSRQPLPRPPPAAGSPAAPPAASLALGLRAGGALRRAIRKRRSLRRRRTQRQTERSRAYQPPLGGGAAARGLQVAQARQTLDFIWVIWGSIYVGQPVANGSFPYS